MNSYQIYINCVIFVTYFWVHSVFYEKHMSACYLLWSSHRHPDLRMAYIDISQDSQHQIRHHSLAVGAVLVWTLAEELSENPTEISKQANLEYTNEYKQYYNISYEVLKYLLVTSNKCHSTNSLYHSNYIQQNSINLTQTGPDRC